MAAKATGSKGKELAVNIPGGKLVSIDDWQRQISESAKTDAARAPLSTSAWFSIRGGKLTFGEMVIKTPVKIIALDFCYDNAYYTEAFDPNKKSSPTCFAVGLEEAGMRPHDTSPQKQDKDKGCAYCWANKFGTAPTGTGAGKACGNNVRVVIMEGDARDPFNAIQGIIRVPPTSVGSFRKLVQSAAATGNAPFSVYALMDVLIPDGKTYPNVTFKLGEPITDLTVATAVMQAKAVWHDQMLSPYPIFGRQEEEGKNNGTTAARPRKRKF